MARCRLGLHRWFVHCVDLSGHTSYRSRICARRCGAQQQQHLRWSGQPEGPWRDATRYPCTHGVGGVPVMACMNCAVEWQNRGLR